ncbi:MAG: 2-oxo acid dehydrogenase subunit E2 [Planctomycetota bacterium]
MAHAKSANPNIFILPDLGEGVHEAELIAWKVSEGDTVTEHQIIAEMETDKALVEVPSPRDGVIKTLHGSEGEILNVGNPLVTYEGGDEPAASPAPAAAPSSNGTAEREDAGTVVGAVGGEIVRGVKGKALAAPAVRRLARDLGVDINQIEGTGIAGRVTKKDVEAFAKDGPRTTPAADSSAASLRSATASTTPAPTTAHAGQTRRPLPPAAPSYQPAPQPMQPPMAPGYGAPMPQPQPVPGYGAPMPQIPGAMPGYGMPQPMYIPVAVSMPMPGYGQGYGVPQPGYGAPAAGVPMAPGYTPSSGSRPIPDPAQQSAGDSRVAFRGVRRTIANRLRESVNTAVHFTVMDEADVTTLDAVRRQLAETSGQKISFLPFVAAAVCRAISPALGGRFGALNATVDEQAEEIVNHGATHLGIATDTDSGLMVPVIPNAHVMGVTALANEIAATAKSARDRSIGRDRLMGSTFTISNVGSHAGKFATPVINVPEVAILAVGKVYDGVVVRDGQAVVGKLMPLSLACDHRVVDGATAALCLAEIVRFLRDEPESLA